MSFLFSVENSLSLKINLYNICKNQPALFHQFSKSNEPHTNFLLYETQILKHVFGKVLRIVSETSKKLNCRLFDPQKLHFEAANTTSGLIEILFFLF